MKNAVVYWYAIRGQWANNTIYYKIHLRSEHNALWLCKRAIIPSPMSNTVRFVSVQHFFFHSFDLISVCLFFNHSPHAQFHIANTFCAFAQHIVIHAMSASGMFIYYIRMYNVPGMAFLRMVFSVRRQYNRNIIRIQLVRFHSSHSVNHELNGVLDLKLYALIVSIVRWIFSASCGCSRLYFQLMVRWFIIVNSVSVCNKEYVRNLIRNL